MGIHIYSGPVFLTHVNVVYQRADVVIVGERMLLNSKLSSLFS